MNRRELLAGIATLPLVLAARATAKAQATRQADPNTLLDINSAPPEKLMTLPNIDLITAKKIIAARPYKAKQDLLAKKVLSQELFNGIQARIQVLPIAKK